MYFCNLHFEESDFFLDKKPTICTRTCINWKSLVFSFSILEFGIALLAKGFQALWLTNQLAAFTCTWDHLVCSFGKLDNNVTSSSEGGVYICNFLYEIVFTSCLCNTSNMFCSPFALNRKLAFKRRFFQLISQRRCFGHWNSSISFFMGNWGLWQLACTCR